MHANQHRLGNVQQMRLDNEIDAKEYQEIKNRYEKTINELMRDAVKTSQLDSDYNQYLDFGFHVLAHLPKYYDEADIQAKQQIVGLMCTEKLVFEKNGFPTIKFREVVQYICRGSMDYKVKKMGLKPIFAFSPTW